MTMKAPNWRFGTVNESQRQMIEEQLPIANSWQRLSLKVQSTGMYGPEFASLLEIVKNYQATQSRPVSTRSWTFSQRLLASFCGC